MKASNLKPIDTGGEVTQYLRCYYIWSLTCVTSFNTFFFSWILCLSESILYISLQAICNAYCGETYGSTDFSMLENVRNAILRMTYYW